MAINDVKGVGAYINNLQKISTQTSVTPTTSTPTFTQQHIKQSSITTSVTYQKHQTQMMELLTQVGFTPDQAEQLSQLHNLNVEQFSRTAVLAHVFSKNEEAFRSFVKTLKNMSQKHPGNVPEGVKSFFSEIDRLLGFDSTVPSKNFQKAFDRPVEDSVNKPYPSKHQSHSVHAPFEFDVNESVKISNLQKLPAKNLTFIDQKNISDYMDFATHTMEDFPTRYHVDLFAQNAFAKRGVSLENYIRLAHEIPPLRLLNLVTTLESQGKRVADLIRVLIDALIQPGSARDQFLVMESTSGILHPAVLSDHNFSAAIPLELIQGSPLLLQFVALDSNEGRLKTAAHAALLMPNDLSQLSQSVAWQNLPPGVYYVLLSALSQRQEWIKTWVKAIVQKRQKQHSLYDDAEDESSSQENQNPTPSKSSIEIPELVFSDPEFTSQYETFLGEVRLPLVPLIASGIDFLPRSEDSGIVVSESEFQAGVFESFGLKFRFLAPYLENTSDLHRRESLKVQASRLFENFDRAIQHFLKNPGLHWVAFESGINTFFAELAKKFEAGRQTFLAAEKVFLEEARAFAEGRLNSEQYEVFGRESSDTKNAFVVSSYIKGSFLLATAGDVPGAISGLSFASLQGGDTPKNLLGEYVSSLKSVSEQKLAPETLQQDYQRRADYAATATGAIQGLYQNTGSEFLESVAILPAAAALEPSIHSGFNPYLKK